MNLHCSSVLSAASGDRWTRRHQDLPDLRRTLNNHNRYLHRSVAEMDLALLAIQAIIWLHRQPVSPSRSAAPMSSPRLLARRSMRTQHVHPVVPLHGWHSIVLISSGLPQEGVHVHGRIHGTPKHQPGGILMRPNPLRSHVLLKSALPYLWGFAVACAADYVVDIQNLFPPALAGGAALTAIVIVKRMAAWSPPPAVGNSRIGCLQV
jgi:hypothetical protein